MAMFMMGPAEILILMVLSLGGRSADLVSLLDPRDYFKHKGIEVAIPKMVELAAQEPKTGADQIAQLLALRLLAEDAAKLKSADQYAAHRQLLEQIAEGSKAQDKQGFAKDFARRTLLALDGKTPTPVKPAAKWREEALSWFPANASLVFAGDTRAGAVPGGAQDASASMAKLMQLMPPHVKKEMYAFVDKLGNIHIERVAFAYVDMVEKPREAQVIVRVTGRVDKDRILKLLGSLGMQQTERKGPAGESLSVLTLGNEAVLFTFVGDNDFLITGGSPNQPKEAILDHVLAVRAKKKASVLEGQLKADLKRIPAKAIGFLVGQVPTEMRSGGPMPRSVIAFMERAPKAFDLQLEGTFDNAEQVKGFVQTVFQGRTTALEELKKVPPIPGLDMAPIQQVLESLQVAGQGDTAKLRMLVPDQATLMAPTMWLGVRAFQAPPPPPKEEKKDD